MSITRFISTLLVSVTTLISCNSEEHPTKREMKTPIEKMDRIARIVSNTSTSGFYIILHIADTYYTHVPTVVLTTDRLYNRLQDKYGSSDDYHAAVAHAIKTNTPLMVSDKLHREPLIHNSIDTTDQLIVGLKTLGRQQLIDSFFESKHNNVLSTCITDVFTEYALIYTLITKWQIFPIQDCETGCLVLYKESYPESY